MLHAKAGCFYAVSPTYILLPGKSHGQRSLVGYSPWGCKELDTTSLPTWFSPLIVKLMLQSYGL